MGNGTGKTVVGLDIEPGYVAAVEASVGRPAVERAALAPLAPGVVRDGEVVDVDTLAIVLRNLFAEHKLGRRVRIGVANQRIVMRMIDLPPLELTQGDRLRGSLPGLRSTSRCHSSRRYSSITRSASCTPARDRAPASSWSRLGAT